MHLFYVEDKDIDKEASLVTITGEDVNHIKNVLRLKQGEKVTVCNGQGTDFLCIIEKVCDKEIKLFIQSENVSLGELDTKIYLFQGLPKKDKMELVIQKATELGATYIIPVMNKRSVVKLEDSKKEEKKLQRWNHIALGAAKQSKRGIIPKVLPVMKYDKAMEFADEECDLIIVPYENERGIEHTKEVLDIVKRKNSVAVFIGPEGGFEEDEINFAKDKSAHIVSLGNRILRTETAALAAMTMVMMACEK
ncbi:MAG: 16S rRNA (uracil(1498)-N(3))-methyltransferase [Lachnospiraceae bacterium]|nr:16S rRNA (uracil(1498)-N(3))-methyltransferase [Lachnospiraceae bacterium]